MSYQVLARKYRPRGFDQVVGQDHVTTPLRNAIRTSRIPHAILLTGPRGTGKTTLARIFACCLNAEKGPTDSPDPDDPACIEIQSGNSTDVQEIDAASRTSVDDVREIIESIRYAAAPGRHRIFIVDEVHMLSTPAFNALLKTLEEPPPMSLFVFCTTNPEKIPFTVVSRCQRYDLRRIATAEVAENLGEIAKQEGLEVSPTSLLAVARAGDGSMRDSLTLLDQLIAFGGEKVDDSRVAEVLDLIDRNVLVSIITACIEGDAAAALVTCRNAWESGVDAKRLGGELLGLIRDLVVLRLAPDAGLVEGADAEVAALRELSGRTEEARLRRMFRALLREQEDLAWAPDPFAVLEVALIRLATMPSGDQVEQLLARIDALERQMRAGGETGGGGGGQTRAPSSGSTAPKRASGKTGASAGPASEAPGAPAEVARPTKPATPADPKSDEAADPDARSPETAPSQARHTTASSETPNEAAARAPSTTRATTGASPERAARPSSAGAQDAAVDAAWNGTTEENPAAARPAAKAARAATPQPAASQTHTQAKPDVAPPPNRPRPAAGPNGLPGTTLPRQNAESDLGASTAPQPSPPGQPDVEAVIDMSDASPQVPVEPDWVGGAEQPGATSSAPLALVFDRLRAFAQEANRGLFAALEGGQLLEQREDLLRIQVIGGISSRRLESRSNELQQVCESFFGRPLRVELETGEERTAPTRQETTDVSATVEGKRQRQDALNHPTVNAALDILGGEILEIKPVGGPGVAPGR